MRVQLACLAACVLAGTAAAVDAQPRFRVAANIGQQVTTGTLTEEQTFDQYFEQGAFTFERTIPRRLFYDAGIALRLTGGVHVGWTASFFSDTGAASVTADVPHPLYFDQKRSTTGDVSGVTRKEIAHHIPISWTGPTVGGIELTFFGGPSIFITEQILATHLNLGLEKEVFPFDTLAFPGVSTETIRDNAIGYHVGADLTWRLDRHLGLGVLIRYSNAKKEFTPTGGQPVTVESGGLHAGGGLRVTF
jgi:opacity protein-like surface antigen